MADMDDDNTPPQPKPNLFSSLATNSSQSTNSGNLFGIFASTSSASTQASLFGSGPSTSNLFSSRTVASPRQSNTLSAALSTEFPSERHFSTRRMPSIPVTMPSSSATLLPKTSPSRSSRTVIQEPAHFEQISTTMEPTGFMQSSISQPSTETRSSSGLFSSAVSTSSGGLFGPHGAVSSSREDVETVPTNTSLFAVPPASADSSSGSHTSIFDTPQESNIEEQTAPSSSPRKSRFLKSATSKLWTQIAAGDEKSSSGSLFLPIDTMGPSGDFKAPKPVEVTSSTEVASSPKKASPYKPLFSPVTPEKKVTPQRRLSIEDQQRRVAIKLLNVPTNLNTKVFMTKRFSKYGKVTRMYRYPNKGTATIHFEDHESALKAKQSGTQLTADVKVPIIFTKYLKTDLESPEIAEENSAVASLGGGFDFSQSPGKATTRPPLRGGTAQTAAERLALLEERDRRIRATMLPSRSRDHSKATFFRGTCPDMCPEKERYMREDQRRLAVYEVRPDDSTRVDHQRAVKEYSRSSADQEEPLPSELRPPAVLLRTMFYLLASLADTGEEAEARGGPARWGRWYEYLWSRTRSIRKDIVQQHLCDPVSVECVEKVVRFHIYSAARLCEEPIENFDPKINNENLTKCLQSLRELYQDLRARDVLCSSEPEFRAYMILMKLDDASILDEVQKLSPEVRQSAEVRFALAVYDAVASNNYARFFKLVVRAAYLPACLMLRYFNQVRFKALRIINHAYVFGRTSSLIPLPFLTTQLGFESLEDTSDYCSYLGMVVGNGTVQLSRISLPEQPESEFGDRRAPRLIESKRAGWSVGAILNGGPLPGGPDDFLEPASSSFDAEGRYIGETAAQMAAVKEITSAQTVVEPVSVTSPEVFQVVDSIIREVVADDLPNIIRPECAQHETALAIFEEALDDVISDEIPELVEEIRGEEGLRQNALEGVGSTLLDSLIDEECRKMASREVEEERAVKRSAESDLMILLLGEVLNEERWRLAKEEMNNVQLTLSSAEEACQNTIHSTLDTECRSIAIETHKETSQLRHCFSHWHNRVTQRERRRLAMRDIPPCPSMADDFVVLEWLRGRGALERALIETKKRKVDDETLDQLEKRIVWKPLFADSDRTLPRIALLLGPKVGRDPARTSLHEWLGMKFSSVPITCYARTVKDLKGVDAVIAVGAVASQSDLVEGDSTGLPCLAIDCEQAFVERISHVSPYHSVCLLFASSPCVECSMLLQQGASWLVTAAAEHPSAEDNPDTSGWPTVGAVLESCLRRTFFNPLDKEKRQREARDLLDPRPNVLLNVYDKYLHLLHDLLDTSNATQPLPAQELVHSLRLPRLANVSPAIDADWSEAVRHVSDFLAAARLSETGRKETWARIDRAKAEFAARGPGGYKLEPLYCNMPWTDLMFVWVNDKVLNSSTLQRVSEIQLDPEVKCRLVDFDHEELFPLAGGDEPTYTSTVAVALDHERRRRAERITQRYSHVTVLDVEGQVEKIANQIQVLNDSLLENSRDTF